MRSVLQAESARGSRTRNNFTAAEGTMTWGEESKSSQIGAPDKLDTLTLIIGRSGEEREGRRFHGRVEAERSNATVLERGKKENNEIKLIRWTGKDGRKRGSSGLPAEVNVS